VLVVYHFLYNLQIKRGQNLSQNNTKKIHFALTKIEEGSPVAIPTETVYGLAASISHPLAIRQIFAIKGRPNNHPLIIHVDDLSMAKRYAFFSPLAEKIASYFWPGPLALILPKKDVVPFEVTGGLNTVGLRCPDHPLSRAIIKKHGSPLAAPSANPFGRISPTTAQHVLDDYNGSVPVVDGGPCPVGLESTILDLSTELPSIRRLGAITKEDLAPFIPQFGQSSTKTSGTHKAHYAPSTALLLSNNLEAERRTWLEKGCTVAVLNIADSTEYAQQLYSELRRLDQLGVDILIAAKPKNDAMGEAILDRLTRASYGSTNLYTEN